MMKKFRISIVLLLALCLVTSIIAVSCDKDEGDGELGSDTTQAISDTAETGSETTAESGDGGDAETTSEAVADTIGKSDDLSDDGFIKVTWGDVN